MENPDKVWIEIKEKENQKAPSEPSKGLWAKILCCLQFYWTAIKLNKSGPTRPH